MSDAPKNMMIAIPEGSTFIQHKTGSTWNDGGSWHSVFFRRSDGSGGSIHMKSDYQPDDLEVSDWDIPVGPNPTPAQIMADQRVRALIADVERLNAACDAMWNDFDRVEKKTSPLAGNPFGIREYHCKAITEAQQRLLAALGAIAGEKP